MNRIKNSAMNRHLIIKKMLLIFTLIFVTACVQNKNIYYWADYSNTLYDTKKEQSAESKERHYLELLKIINNASTYQKKVPPGIYFELSMYESEKGNYDKASMLLNKEYALYPEAKAYIKNIKMGDKDE